MSVGACSDDAAHAKMQPGAGGHVDVTEGAGGSAGTHTTAMAGADASVHGPGGSGGGMNASMDASTSDAANASNGDRYRPKPGTSWQWQLSGALDSSFDVQMYDIDLIETTPAEIDTLHAAGRKVICYFDTAYEPGRPDSAALMPYRGNPVDGWPGQFWLDVRRPAVVDAMKARIALAQDKGCDGVEADDVDARSNNPGFDTSPAEQQAFIRSLAVDAHAHGLAFGLKNDLEEIAVLIGDVDFAINEECFAFSECDALVPFITAGKAVFEVEYTDGDLAAKGADVCPGANALGFSTLIKRLDLDPPRFACSDL